MCVVLSTCKALHTHYLLICKHFAYCYSPVKMGQGGMDRQWEQISEDLGSEPQSCHPRHWNLGYSWVSVTFCGKRNINDTTNLTGWCEHWQLYEISQTLNQVPSRQPFIYLFIAGHASSPLFYRAGNRAAEFGWLAQGYQLIRGGINL